MDNSRNSLLSDADRLAHGAQPPKARTALRNAIIDWRLVVVGAKRRSIETSAASTTPPTSRSIRRKLRTAEADQQRDRGSPDEFKQ
jgi:hypothetical protein